MQQRRDSRKTILGILSLLFVAFLWAKKDLLSLFSSMPKEELLPLVITTLAVSCLKVGLLSGGVLLIRRLILKFKNK